MRTAEQIHTIYLERKKRLAPVHSAALALQRIYNGEHDLVLPEINKDEKAAVVNLIQLGVDQHAMRIASVMPTIACPATKTGPVAQKRADDRRKTLLAWHHQSNLPRKWRRRSRHLVGYGMAPMLIRPSSRGVPIWELRSPLATFPPTTDPDDINPPDCIFAYTQSRGYLQACYPDIHIPGRDNDTVYDCLEYIDADQHSLIACGKDGYGQPLAPIELVNSTNLANKPLVVIPGRITLDRLQGQFDQMIGMYEGQAELWALQIHAVKRGIFQEMWLESVEGQTPEVISQADPYSGEIGIVTGGRIQQYRTDPGFQTLPAIDRLERAQRVTGAIPAELGGEAGSNIRTGRRGSQVLSAGIDFHIQEHQEILAAALEIENTLAFNVAKAYWPNTSRTYYIPGIRASVTYTPDETFDTDTNYVSYAYAGTDTSGLVIEMGQRVGMGTLSKQTFMERDPAISDPDAERDRIVIEALETATISGLQAMAADPNSPYQPADWARLSQLVIEDNMPLYKAIGQIQEESQQRQADAQQGMLAPEQLQPGLAAPGAPGTPMAGDAIPPPAPSQTNLNSLLMSLRGPTMQVPAERG